MTTQELVSSIKSSDEKARGEAWQQAGPVGAIAVKPLAKLGASAEPEVSRAAIRALWMIVRHAGRPGASGERKQVVSELLPLLSGPYTPRVRCEAIWMLSEVAGDEAAKPLGAVLADRDLREDARMALERIEGEAALAVLRSALTTAPVDFRPNLAQSLRRRGVEVPGIACVKLVPAKKTQVVRKAERPA